MAKKKGAKKAARGAKKRAAKRASRAVAGASSEARNEAAAMDDRFLTDADITRTLTQLLAGVQSLTNGEDSVPDRLSRIESAQQTAQTTILGLQGRAITAGTASETPAPRTSQQHNSYREGQVHGWRQALWAAELTQSTPLPKPRTSFIGRAMFDLDAVEPSCPKFAIAKLFKHIKDEGSHHLDQNAILHLESVDGEAPNGRRLARSGLSKLFNKRFEQLCGFQLAAEDEDSDCCWLLPIGRDVFRGWPDWQVEHDDIHCQGELRLARRPVAAVRAAEADAAPRDGST